MTNIKWDYSEVHKLKGEVSLVERGVLREFEIDKEEFIVGGGYVGSKGGGGGEVEIAERLWKIIEG